MKTLLHLLVLTLFLGLSADGLADDESTQAAGLQAELAKAVFEGSKEDAVALLENGVDPNIVSREYRLGTPMAWAVIASSRSRDASLVKLLCGYGADPNLVDLGRWTPLHRAMYHSALEAAEVLLECGADPNAKDPDGGTPFSFAVDSLTAARTGGGKRTQEEYRTIVELMLGHGAHADVRPVSGGFTPLASAVAADDIELVEQLLNAGAPPDVWFGRCADDEEPCVQFTALKRVFPTRENAAQIATLLLSAGADPNIYSVELNPLKKAALFGDVEMVEALIAYGADLKRYGPDALKVAGSQEVKEVIRAHMSKLDEEYSE